MLTAKIDGCKDPFKIAAPKKIESAERKSAYNQPRTIF